MKKRTDEYYDISGMLSAEVKYQGETYGHVSFADSSESALDNIKLEIYVPDRGCMLRFFAFSPGNKSRVDIRLGYDELEELVEEIKKLREEAKKLY